MSLDRDYYGILRVNSDAPETLIHTSYRSLLQRLTTQPDGGPDAADEALLTEAYDVLSNPQRRAAYDLARDVAASPDDYATTAVLDPAVVRFAAHRCLFCGNPHGLDRALGREDHCGTCASPLYPAERHRFEYSGQRMLKRIPKLTDVELYVNWPQATPYTAQMRDISLNGMQLLAEAPLQHNQIVKIDCPTCAAIARVAHCKRERNDSTGAPGRWAVGVEFLTLRFGSARGTFVSAHA
jgi:hypothetical protein